MGYIYIKALAAQQGYKTLTVACLNIKTWNNQLNVKNLEKSKFFDRWWNVCHALCINNPIKQCNICYYTLSTDTNTSLGSQKFRFLGNYERYNLTRKAGNCRALQIFHRKWKYGRFAHAQWKICNINLIYGRIAEIFSSCRKSGSRNTMVTSDFRPEVEIRPFCACAMHPATIIGTVRSLWTWLWGRYHVPQHAFLVIIAIVFYASDFFTYYRRSMYIHITVLEFGRIFLKQ